ncbi:MAG: mandelate racemase/muconate lactonizing protein [Candidatus Latescibacteria bacterium]|jgi:L-alanine-DL-glutamate epimerase-like enolase superfamily enzyme|nr:mandelate racemase/muconate lactonizing protein [Candidatus Latescibacterota bacterium]
MKITEVEAIPINVPLKSGLTTKTAHGEHIDSPYVLVRIHTDSGLQGLGEATVAPRWSGETSQSTVGAIEELIAPLLVGRDPLRRNALCGLMHRALTGNSFTKSAIEMALWDLQGKALNCPVHELLGGAVRGVIPMKMVVGAFPVDQALSLAERFLDWGAKCLKVKVGLDPVEDLARVASVRKLAGPDIKIGIDANCGWSLPEARDMLDRMEPFDILFAEQPIGRDQAYDMATLRSASKIPIMADEDVFTIQDASRIASAHAADIISVYPGKHGGISQTLSIVHIGAGAGMVCHMGSNLELGIATAAMLHVAAAVPQIDSERYPGDLLGPLYHEADMIMESLNLGPVVATVPEGPGLGVELDMDQVKRWRV